MQPIAQLSAGRIGVLHVIDTLETGGMERVAVNLANSLPRERYAAHLCATRREGGLAALVAEDVGRICLHRRGRIDLGAIRRLAQYIRQHNIRLMHAHGSSLFTARAAALLARNVTIVWHDHYGRYLEHERPAWLFRLATRGIGGVIAVNEPLAEWARHKLGFGAERVWYVPNFVCVPQAEERAPELPGTLGARIVCVANLRPQKDHVNLVRAMQLVRRAVPQAHLLLVGSSSNATHRAAIEREIEGHGLTGNISILGERHDIAAILRACDVGVLGSASEGLPLALIEYGMAGLPTVATEVGQCAEVLDGGRAGLLVPPGEPRQLAEALLNLLRDAKRAADYGAKLQAYVRANYSMQMALERIDRVYAAVLGGTHRVPALVQSQVDLAQ